MAQRNAHRMLFAASAIKTFVLCEALRQTDSPDVVEILEERELALDSTVWSFGSPTFTPMNLAGIVSERTTMEAMITRSDNTATDMMFKVAGADNVRAFIASAGLANTLVPDSTRAFTGYLFGAPDYAHLTWERLQEVVKDPRVNPFLNTVQTLASSADDLVSYYSRALQGAFFTHAETLNEFRRVLTLWRFHLPRAAAARRERVREKRQRRHVRLSRALARRRPVLRQPVGVLRVHHQLVCGQPRRPGHGRPVLRGDQRIARLREGGARVARGAGCAAIIRSHPRSPRVRRPS